MRFVWPQALWLLLSLPALIGTYEWIIRRRRAAGAVRHTQLALVRAAAEACPALRQRIPPLIFLLGVAAALLAIARPTAMVPAHAQRGTVILAMDVSYSMAAVDVAPTRLAAAQAAAAEFVRNVPSGIRIGVVAFGGYAEIVRLPTVDKAQVLTALTQLKYQPYTAIGTALLAALVIMHPLASVDPKYDLFSHTHNLPDARYAREVSRLMKPAQDDLERPVDPSTLIILVSDGRSTLGVPEPEAAKTLADYGIRVYTIGVGTEYGGSAQIEGSPPIHAEFEEESLKRIASMTDGEYFHASDPNKLHGVYQRLSQSSRWERRETEVSAVFAALGGMLLVLAAILSLAWHGRLAETP